MTDDQQHEHEHGPELTEPTTRTALDAIGAGAQQLLMNVRLRMAEANAALDEGKFIDAAQRIAEAQGALSPIVAAQTYIAIADGAYMLRASELKEGMKLSNIGEIGRVEKLDCPVHGEAVNVVVTVGEQELPFVGETLLYVEREREEQAA